MRRRLSFTFVIRIMIFLPFRIALYIWACDRHRFWLPMDFALRCLMRYVAFMRQSTKF